LLILRPVHPATVLNAIVFFKAFAQSRLVLLSVSRDGPSTYPAPYFMMLKSENFTVGFHSQEPRCGTLWGNTSEPLGAVVTMLHIALKSTASSFACGRCSQCQAAFLYFFIIPQIQKFFSGFIKIQSNFLRVMATCCLYFNGTSNSVVFLYGIVSNVLFFKNKGSWLSK
jgi:hypothetical protein